MSRPFIVVGDRLGHGGVALAGAPRTDVNGMRVARIGGDAMCGKHVPTTIASADSRVLVHGEPVARKGGRTGCGGMLVPSRCATGLR